MSDDERLQRAVGAAAGGDTEAFRGIFEELVDRVLAYARSHARDSETAEDVTQETFVELWKALPRIEWRGPEPFYGFVFTIARRRLSKHGRSAGTSVPLRDEEVAAGTTEIAVEDYRRLLSSMSRLSGSMQEILRLRYWSDLSFAEIAATLSINEQAARVRHHRAIRQLQAIIR